MPTLSLMGSDLARVDEVNEMTCPFTGARVLLVPALYPDVAIIHVHRADKYGNAQIDGYTFMDQDIAKASAIVIPTPEEIPHV